MSIGVMRSVPSMARLWVALPSLCTSSVPPAAISTEAGVTANSFRCTVAVEAVCPGALVEVGPARDSSIALKPRPTAKIRAISAVPEKRTAKSIHASRRSEGWRGGGVDPGVRPFCRSMPVGEGAGRNVVVTM